MGWGSRKRARGGKHRAKVHEAVAAQITAGVDTAPPAVVPSKPTARAVRVYVGSPKAVALAQVDRQLDELERTDPVAHIVFQYLPQLKQFTRERLLHRRKRT